MNILGLIGAVALLPKYKKAKADYEDLKEHVDTVRATVQEYNYHKLDEYIKATTPEEKPNERPDGLCLGTLLRVGNLVGKLMRAQTTVTISNTSKKPFYVKKIMVEPKLWDEYVRMFSGSIIDGANEKKPEIEVDRIVEPGETISVNVVKGISAISDMGKLRDVFCEACGRKLITSCWKTNVEGVETADIRMWWTEVKDGQSYGSTKDMYVLNLPGIVRYCLEAFYP